MTSKQKAAVSITPVYNCPKCQKVFSDLSFLNDHKKRAHSSFFKCSKCNEEFWELPILKNHMRTEHESDLLKCQYCYEIFLEIEKLKIHISEIHYKQTTYLSGSVVSCRFCMAGFENCTAFAIHNPCKSQILSNIKMLKCQHCIYRFKNEENLKKHIARIHMNTRISLDSGMSCRFCRTLFLNQNSFSYHLSIAHGGKNLQISQKKAEVISVVSSRWSSQILTIVLNFFLFSLQHF